MKVTKRAPNKTKVYDKVQTFISKYTTILVCDIKDMPANNIHKMRKQLRDIDSEVLCGKTTVMIKSIKELLEKGKLPNFHNKASLDKLTEVIVNHQVCLIFTNRDIGEITKISDSFKIEKQSKVGAISPIEVILPAGPTGMDASQVELFQNLRIQTKVVKNQLDIINDTKILVIGQKITLTEINLMNRFNIKPFRHQIQTIQVYLGGKLYDSGILSINNESMGKCLSKAISNIASFGLATGISNKASAPHSILNAFRNVLGLSVGCDVEVKQAKGLLQAASSAPVKVEAKKEEPKKEAPKKDDKKKPEVKKEEDDEDVGFGGLF